MMWSPDSYLKQLYAGVVPSDRFQASTRQEWSEWRTRLKERFGTLLGEYPAPAVAPAATVLETVDCGGYMRQRIRLETLPGLSMPVYVLIPKRRGGVAGAVIACHGHGYGSRDIVGLNPDGTPKTGEPGYQKNFAVELADRGLLVVAPELLGFGDRKLAEEAEAANSCQRLSSFFLSFGQTMAGYRVYETLRCVDYLRSRDDVDPERIGIMGISGGGLVSAFAAALDERISAAVVSGFVNTFESSILAMHHCIDNFVPGLSRVAELPDLVGLIAPRPLLMEAGKDDRIFPLHGTLRAYEQLQGVYRLLEAEDRLALDLFEGGHEISGSMAYDWFARMWG